MVLKVEEVFCPVLEFNEKKWTFAKIKGGVLPDFRVQGEKTDFRKS